MRDINKPFQVATVKDIRSEISENVRPNCKGAISLKWNFTHEVSSVKALETLSSAHPLRPPFRQQCCYTFQGQSSYLLEPTAKRTSFHIYSQSSISHNRRHKHQPTNRKRDKTEQYRDMFKPFSFHHSTY